MITSSIRRFINTSDRSRKTFLEVRSTNYKSTSDSLRVIEVAEDSVGAMTITIHQANDGATAITRLLADRNWTYEDDAPPAV